MTPDNSNDSADTGYPSMAACHRATGIPRATLRRAKVANCGAFTAGGRIRLRPLIEWLLTDKGADLSGDPDLAWKHARAERERFRLERDKGLHYNAAEYEARLSGLIRRLQGELQRRLLAVVPGEAAHLPARSVERILRDHLSNWATYCEKQAEAAAKKLNITDRK